MIIIREVTWFKWHNWFSYLFLLTDLSSNVLSSQVRKMISSNYQFCRAHLGLCKSSCILCASTMLSPRIKCLQSGRSQSCFVANVQGRMGAHLPPPHCYWLCWVKSRKTHVSSWGTTAGVKCRGLCRGNSSRGMFQAAGTADEVRLMKGMVDEITHESGSLHKDWVEGPRSLDETSQLCGLGVLQQVPTAFADSSYNQEFGSHSHIYRSVTQFQSWGHAIIGGIDIQAILVIDAMDLHHWSCGV